MMVKTFSSFLKELSYLTLGVLLLGATIYGLFIPEKYLNILPFALLMFFVSSLFVRQYLVKISHRDDANFSFKFMMTSFLKMFIYILFGVLYIILDSENALTFLINYFVLYFIYLAHEVRSVIKTIDKSRK